MFLKIFIFSLLFITSVFAQKNALQYSQSENVLAKADVELLKNTLLKEARNAKNYNDISLIGYTIANTALQSSYRGSAGEDYKFGQDLIFEAIDNGKFSGALLFISVEKVSNLEKTLDILHYFSSKYSFQNKSFNNSKANSIKRIFATIILDSKLGKDDTYKTIVMLEDIESKKIEDYFFLAHLYRYAGITVMANNYINIACKRAEKGTKIAQFCSDSNNIVSGDSIESAVVNDGCKANIMENFK